MTQSNANSLVADIGGTNTRVAMATGTVVDPDTVQKFKNQEHPNLESVLSEYLGARSDIACQNVCVAVAGPVRNNVGELTNRDWRFDHAALAKATGATKIAILNDLQAQGHALPFVPDEKLRNVVSAEPQKLSKTQLVIGVGTGFNAAPVYQTAAGPTIPPSESGHASLPIRTDAELRLCQFVEKAHGFSAVEDVLSGRGFERIYQWLSSEDGEATDKNSAQIMAGAEDGSDPRAQETIRHFVTMLGRVTGDLALIQLPFGGIYLIGGMARAVAPYFERYDFAGAFHDKGRFGEFMGQFPVYVLEDDFAALTGCASHLQSLPN